MTEEQKVKEAQKVYDAVLAAFPNLKSAMVNAQNYAKRQGFVETILGRRRHLPDMMLPEFEFKPTADYVNPDIDPMNPETLKNKDQIPKRIVDALKAEFKDYKYFGQIVKRTDELKEKGIRVYNNRPKINDARRQCLNSIIQGSAADQTKLAILRLENDPEWKEIGGRLLVPVHDELIAEVPLEHWKRGGEILSRCMVEAADFLPFPSKCDVTTTLRWYGLEYPCKYSQPASLIDMTEDEVKWVQYMLVECEYILPTFKDENGDKPRGDAAVGVNGKVTPEMNIAIKDFKLRYNIQTDEEFISRIHDKVVKGE